MQLRTAARLALIPALALALGACEILVGAKIDTCGEHPAGGGPAVIVTKDQELCDVVRLRVTREVDANELTRETIDHLVDRSLSWERRDTLDEFVAAVRKDAGDAIADAVRRAVDAVLAQSQRTTRPDCGDIEPCLVKGAAKGVRIALLYAQPARPKNEETTPGK